MPIRVAVVTTDNENSHSNGPINAFGRLERMVRQPASRASCQTDIESDRWRLIKLKINLLNIAYAGSKAIK